MVIIDNEQIMFETHLLRYSNSTDGSALNGHEYQKKSPGAEWEYGHDNVWCPFCYCGQSSKMTRIVGGWSTQVNEYPWMVALTAKGRVFCGGTLINDLYVLTAAHCISRTDTIKMAEVNIYISEHNTAIADEAMTHKRKGEKFIIHPKYGDSVRFNNDIALIQLNSRISLSYTSARPACLPPPGEDFFGEEGRIIGWGQTKEGGKLSVELMEARIDILSNEICGHLPNFPSTSLTSNMFCAGHIDGGRDSCQGDSGGPLLITDDEGRFIVVGIVSWGVGCGRRNKPGVYTKVNNYLDWIIQHTKNGCYCF